MKKVLTIGIMLLFIGMTISSATEINLEKQSSVVTLGGNILYVGGNGTGNYTNIQDAIIDSENGDTVFVYDEGSPYFENLNVSKSISLIGEDRDTTVINGSGGEIVVNISADGVIVSGFTIVSYKIINTETYLLDIQSDNNVIHDNLVTGNTTYGIFIYDSAYNNISNNIINGDFIWSGVAIQFCNHTTINNNIISVKGHGITLWSSNNNRVIGNTITYCSNGIFLSLTINSYIYGNMITNNNYTGIALDGFSANSVIIRNNISYNEWIGILIFGNSLNDEIIQNNFIGNKKKNAYFVHPLSWIITIVIIEGIKPFFPKIYWNGNYWDETRLQSYFIPGFICPTGRIFSFFPQIRFPINWINLDRNPAQEPYNIGVL